MRFRAFTEYAEAQRRLHTVRGLGMRGAKRDIDRPLDLRAGTGEIDVDLVAADVEDELHCDRVGESVGDHRLLVHAVGNLAHHTAHAEEHPAEGWNLSVDFALPGSTHGGAA